MTIRLPRPVLDADASAGGLGGLPEWDLSDLYAEGYASKLMPESYTQRLAESKLITVRHLLPMLEQKLQWPEQKRTIILIGTRGEVPLSHLMNPERHERHSRVWQDRMRYYYAMPYEGRYIWGATAGMIRNLYTLVYGAP